MKQQPPVPANHQKEMPSDATQIWELQTRKDGSSLRWAYAVAVLFHLVLLALQLPASSEVEAADAVKQPIYVIQQTPIRPPDLPPEEVRKPKAVKKFIPDPTPDDPEPMIHDQDLQVDLDFQQDDLFDTFVLPSAPPPLPQDSPIYVTGDVQAPVALEKILPQYTKAARWALKEGIVIVQAEIGPEGKVHDVTVLKGLGFGLDESAVEAVSRWRFVPATLRGKPVAVYFNLTVRFTLQ
ncbi:MAG: energy transducer TonB [Deltaproteobacteria bacterium]|nr:energy transducer TonB [Deltaproteobacteria bacterium]